MRKFLPLTISGPQDFSAVVHIIHDETESLLYEVGIYIRLKLRSRYE
jgi:hypothetical protein